ncbi:ABC transporter substrate-binding protein [Amaricoccus macauensis]|uniref:ABC transporter substrate-binding protein n=1 Tax=Amaricoccus macauensis TaxID=57001 RepID=UPI003C7CBB98
MKRFPRVLLGACAVSALATAGFAQTSITVATVNNGDMIRMQGLMQDFNDKNPDIEVNWVTLEENALRQQVTTDIATGGGQYDVLTIGTYEVPIWGRQGWLEPLEGFSDDYDVEDILPAVREALSVDGTMYAAPFYGESAMIMYRTDLVEEAGVEMPDSPTWSQVMAAAEAMTDKDNEVYGICLRGKAGWGENMAFLGAMSNSYGARWFDMDWNPQFDSPEWEETVTDYLHMMQNYGPPGASSNGFNENLTLFQQGKCGMWIDATVAAGFVTGPDSTVADSVGFAQFPNKEGVDNHGNWLWAWSLAIPASSQKKEAAQTFIEWATSKGYTELVASEQGWRAAPPGTRTSLYENADYQADAPFAAMTLDSMNAVDTQKPSVQDIPYTGAQFVAIPEFQGIGTDVGQQMSAAVAGQKSAEEALADAQQLTDDAMIDAGYK